MQIQSSYSKHPDCKAAVVLTIDRRYLPYALFVIDQIAGLNPRRGFGFGILTMDDLGSHPLLEKHAVEVVKLDTKHMPSGLAHSDRISIATYLRFFVVQAFPNMDRILYLDSDLFIRRGEFDRLMWIDMGHYAVAGARDPVQFRHPKRRSRDMRHLGLPLFNYLSAGVLLIDSDRFRNDRIAERALALARERPDDLLLFDQTALNAVLQGEFAELPPGWNWLYNFRTLYLTELYDPPILHFAGRRKPWNTLDGQFPLRYSQAYLSFFQKYFPDMAAPLALAKPPSAHKLGHLRYLLNHANGLRKLVPRLDQFNGDFDIRL